MVDWLLIRDRDSWPSTQVVLLDPDKPVYLLNATPDLRAFMTVLGPGEVELTDIMQEKTLRMFLEANRTGKAG